MRRWKQHRNNKLNCCHFNIREKKIDSKKLSIFLLHLIRSFLSTITFNNNEINVVKYQWSNHIYANLDIHIEIENNLFKLKNKSFFFAKHIQCGGGFPMKYFSVNPSTDHFFKPQYHCVDFYFYFFE